MLNSGESGICKVFRGRSLSMAKRFSEPRSGENIFSGPSW